MTPANGTMPLSDLQLVLWASWQPRRTSSRKSVLMAEIHFGQARDYFASKPTPSAWTRLAKAAYRLHVEIEKEG